MTSLGCTGALGAFLLVIFLIWMYFGVFSGSNWRGEANRGSTCYSVDAPRNHNYGSATAAAPLLPPHLLPDTLRHREEHKARRQLSTLTETEENHTQDQDWLQSNLNEMHRETAPRSSTGGVFNSKLPAWNL